MNSTRALTHRPFIAAVAGLLLVSACSTAAESTPTPTTPSIDVALAPAPDTTQAAPSPTTQPAATVPVTVAPTTAAPTTTPGPIAAVDLSTRSVFGVSAFDTADADAITSDISAQLGSPTVDSGWQPTEGQFNCAGSTAIRMLWWGDLRMTFERYQAGDVVRDEVSAWTVGDPTLFELAPFGDVPATPPSNIVTLEGIGLGSTLADIEAAWTNVNNAGDNLLLVVADGGTLLLKIDDGGQVIGFGDGPFDCPVDEIR